MGLYEKVYVEIYFNHRNIPWRASHPIFVLPISLLKAHTEKKNRFLQRKAFPAVSSVVPIGVWDFFQMPAVSLN